MPDTALVARGHAGADTWKAAQRKDRDGRLKSSVCAGYRSMTEGGALVQAAHIEKRTHAANDNPNTGLAQTPDAALRTVRSAGHQLPA